MSTSEVVRNRSWKPYAAFGVGLLALAGGVGAQRVRRCSHLGFDRRYHEEVVLKDGTRALLRLVRPSDKRLLASGMQQLSAEGRYRRFHVPKHDLTRAELKYFTEVDCHTHFAIGAVRRGGRREGLGIARFVCLLDRSDTAEIALAIADEAQGKELGRALLVRLADAARERGIKSFSCEVLATNYIFMLLLNSVFINLKSRRDGPIVSVDIDIRAH